MTKFTFEQCLSFRLLFKLAKKLRCTYASGAEQVTETSNSNETKQGYLQAKSRIWTQDYCE